MHSVETSISAHTSRRRAHLKSHQMAAPHIERHPGFRLTKLDISHLSSRLSAEQR